jgi:hypothetical protein
MAIRAASRANGNVREQPAGDSRAERPVSSHVRLRKAMSSSRIRTWVPLTQAGFVIPLDSRYGAETGHER